LIIPAFFSQRGTINPTKDTMISPPRDTTHDNPVILLINAKMTHLKTEENIWDVESKAYNKLITESAFDGKLLTKISRSSDQKYPMGLRNKFTNRNEYCNTSGIWPVLVFCRGTHPDMIGGDIASFTQARRSNLGGKPVIELTRLQNELQGETKLWVDPSRGYTVIRSDDYTDEGQLYCQITITQSRGADELYVPQSWKVNTYKRGKLISTILGTLQDWELNPSTTIKDFRITYPVGTRLIDLTRSGEERQFIIRQDSSEREILPEESWLTNDQLLSTELGKRAGQSITSRWWSRSGLVIGVAIVFILAAVAIFLACRRHRRVG
jgi:hypothetical protein